jgi:glycosyltransferase involved in cell wall biosynthesis
LAKLPKVIYITAFRSSFIIKDEELLKQHAQVVSIGFKPIPRWKTPWSMCIQFILILWNIRGSKAIVCQFAGFHTIIPVMLGKLFHVKTSIILLGAECHNYPIIQHGNFRKKLLSMVTRFSFQYASQLLPIDQSLAKFENQYDTLEPLHQGFLGILPDLKTPYQVIPHGFNDELFKPNFTEPLAKTFITAASSIAPPVFQRKGIDLIISAARLLPDCHFSILCKNDYLNSAELPSNVTILEAVPYSELPSVLASHAYYIQASIAEGLPNALCEAMLCGCIPIGSNVFAIPHVIGETGVIVNERSADSLVSAIKSVVSNTEFSSQKARTRIQNLFPMAAREKNLIKAIF